MGGLERKLSELKNQSETRRQKLMDNSAFLQFNWKANVVESWIGKIFFIYFRLYLNLHDYPFVNFALLNVNQIRGKSDFL